MGKTPSPRAMLTLVVALWVALGVACGSRRVPTACPQLVAHNDSFGPGLLMHFQYPAQGSTFEVEIVDDHHIRFEGLEGPVAGVRGRPHFDRTDIADGISLITWEEDNGTIVSMVVDMVHLEVHAREVRNGRLTALDGIIQVLHPAH